MGLTVVRAMANLLIVTGRRARTNRPFRDIPQKRASVAGSEACRKFPLSCSYPLDLAIRSGTK